MGDIQQLSASVVNKIAAGEVIERPASVVKELVENSVDAGATRVDVAIAGGGGELVRVADDGAGIAAGQLPLAVASHATSKIRDADDLFRVGTLGFRGEALASIAEVSRLTLRSRIRDAAAGAELVVLGGRAGEVVPCGCPPGTIVEVRNLYYNTPVRQKFLRTKQTELGHASEALHRVALAHVGVHFTLRHNDREVCELPPSGNLRERIGRLFGQDLAEHLIWVESSDGDVRLRGYVAAPSHSRANTRMQYLYLNGRHIRDRSLQHALGEAYRGLLLSGRFPVAFLHLEMPPEMVDVNVHPTKLEVRFADGGRLYSQLLGTLRTKFLATDMTARGQASRDDGPAAAHDTRRTAELQQELVQWAKGSLAAAGAATSPSGAEDKTNAEVPRQSELGLSWPAAARQPLDLIRLNRSWPAAPSPHSRGGYRDGGPHVVPHDDRAAESSLAPAKPSADDKSDDESNPRPATDASRWPPALQVQNRYLITENEHGVLVIDQHALHERILYELLREKVLAGGVDTQRLLVPEPVDLAPPEAAAVIQSRELLEQLGVTVEPFGGDTVLVTGYPAMLANLGPAEVLRELAEQILAGGRQPDRRDLLDELLHMIACKAAIKAGDRLSPEEVAALLQQRDLVNDTHHCPHGRPTALVFTREELDRQFLRK